VPTISKRTSDSSRRKESYDVKKAEVHLLKTRKETFTASRGERRPTEQRTSRGKRNGPGESDQKHKKRIEIEEKDLKRRPSSGDRGVIGFANPELEGGKKRWRAGNKSSQVAHEMPISRSHGDQEPRRSEVAVPGTKRREGGQPK